MPPIANADGITGKQIFEFKKPPFPFIDVLPSEGKTVAAKFKQWIHSLTSSANLKIIMKEVAKPVINLQKKKPSSKNKDQVGGAYPKRDRTPKTAPKEEEVTPLKRKRGRPVTKKQKIVEEEEIVTEDLPESRNLALTEADVPVSDTPHVYGYEAPTTVKGTVSTSSLKPPERHTSQTILDGIFHLDPDVVKVKRCRTDTICMVHFISRFAPFFGDVQSHVDILNDLYTVFSVAIPWISSRIAWFTQINNVYRFRFGLESRMHHISKTIMKLPALEKKQNIEAQADVLHKKHSNMAVYQFNDIVRIRAIGLASEIREELFIGLALATGSRTGELLLASSYKPHGIRETELTKEQIEGKDPLVNKEETVTYNNLKINGLAKKQQNARSYFRIVPALGPVANTEIPKLITKMRALFGISEDADGFGSYKNNDINATTKQFDNSINLVVTKYFDEDPALAPTVRPQHTTAHTLRKIYANMAYDKFKWGINWSRTAYIARILGHSGNSLFTALSYENVRIEYEAPTRHPDIQNELAELKQTMETLFSVQVKGPPEKEVRMDNISVPKRVPIVGPIDDPLAEIKAQIIMMNSNHIKVTWTRLKSLGYGTRVIAAARHSIPPLFGK